MYIHRAITALAAVTLLSIATISPAAHADDAQPDNWGNVPDTRSPHPDTKGRSGHWWWPQLPQRGPKAAEQAGNRGRVFGTWQTSVSSEVPAPPAPPAWIPGTLATCGTFMLLNNIFFLSDSAALNEAGRAETEKLISEMGKSPNDTLVCVGHTDDTGTEAYNQQLGLRRAQAVVDYMTASGISPERLRAESKGETEPAVPNDTAPNRALNRRVVFQYKVGN